MLELTQAGESVSITLTKESGEKLRRLIEQNTPCNFTSYLQSINLSPSNIYAMLDGRKKMSWKTIEKLIANATLEAECQILIRINTTSGINVGLAQCLKQDVQLSLEDMVEYETEQ